MATEPQPQRWAARGWVAAWTAGLALRLWVAWRPLDVLIPKVLSDDAFYYFRIAENLASGLGPTFDGLRLTNGFHPLWAALLTALSVAAPQGQTPIAWALSLAALMDSVSGTLIYLAVARALGRRGPATLAALAYLLHPMAILEGVNGLETALAGLALTGLFAYYVCTLRRRTTYGAYAVFGLLAGLLALARTDYIFFVVALGLERLWQERARAAPPLLAAAAVCSLVVAPWLVWSRLQVGTWVQTSGLAVPYVV
ncbi:MAG: hypothetical protein GX605_01050, partial [Chloroflexi bacterium]|nr:hypothetical protein [Chloroflexota bacterium]